MPPYIGDASIFVASYICKRVISKTLQNEFFLIGALRYHQLKYDRREIVNRAHKIRRITPAKTFFECLRQSWAESKELARMDERRLELERIRDRLWAFSKKSEHHKRPKYS